MEILETFPQVFLSRINKNGGKIDQNKNQNHSILDEIQNLGEERS